ncbi:Pol I core factor CF [Podochytrium sp. JEL0797]|nr:Pol I core factor CF [Podochytrium sp. JEL0797]
MAKCSVCRSSHFRRDPGTGLRFCANGHQQRTARQIEVGDDETLLAGARLRKTRRARKARKVRFAKGFRGATPLLLFEAFQLSLRAQAKALCELKGVPPLLETIVRDLWLIYVSKQGITTSKKMRENVAAKRKRAKEAPHSENAANLNKDSPLVNYILAPAYQLVFIYLACVQLRLPVLLADVIKWADSGTIPYLNALDSLPPDFLQYVSRHALAMKLFRKSSVPTHTSLRKRTTALISVFAACGVTFPEPNTPLILLRWVKALNVPPELYVCAEIVRMVLGFVEGGGIKSRSNNRVRKDVVLVSCLIVAIKMCYSMEKVERTVFISWISNLPTLESITDSIKLYIHKERAASLNKRTAGDFDSQFHGSVGKFATYCRDYFFDKPRLNVSKWGFQKIIEGLEPTSPPPPEPPLPSPPLRHPLAPYINAPDTTFTTDPGSFKIKHLVDLHDVMGEVDESFATLIELGSRLVMVDGRVILKGVGAVERGLEGLVDLFEMQNGQ